MWQSINIITDERSTASHDTPCQVTLAAKRSHPSTVPLILACQHRSFECIQVSCRGTNKCITNFNRLTTVANVIDALLDDLSEKRYLTIADCCLYVERPPYLFPLKTTDFIQDILLRYASSDIHFKLSFKRNASPSRFAQRKKLLRTPLPPTTITNAYEQLRIQESLIRRQHEIITELRKTTLHTTESSRSGSSSNYENYFDWVTRQDDEDSDHSRYVVLTRSPVPFDDHLPHCRTSSDVIPTCRRQSRQDNYQQAVNREASVSSRSLSQVRFRPASVNNRKAVPTPFLPTTVVPMKSILKKSADAVSQRTSSVDRDIARLTSLKLRRNSVYTSDEADDDTLSDRSTTDSCLGSLSSNDSNSYLVTEHQLETLVWTVLWCTLICIESFRSIFQRFIKIYAEESKAHFSFDPPSLPGGAKLLRGDRIH